MRKLHHFSKITIQAHAVASGVEPPKTSCCHVCRTSLNQYRRDFIACTACNRIVCRNCFGTKLKNITWEEAQAEKETYQCPACQRNCPCPRCKKKPKLAPLRSAESSSGRKRRSSHTEESEKNDELLSPESSDSQETDGGQVGLSPQIVTKHSDTVLASLPKEIAQELEVLLHREEKCDQMIKEMERFLYLIFEEKEEIARKRRKLEVLLKED